MFKPLDPILHSELRLAIVSLLIGNKQVEFNHIKKMTGGTAGNISASMTKLKDAGYIEVKKSFRDNFPLTEFSLTRKGIEAFENYVNNLKDYIEK